MFILADFEATYSSHWTSFSVETEAALVVIGVMFVMTVERIRPFQSYFCKMTCLSKASHNLITKAVNTHHSLQSDFLVELCPAVLAIVVHTQFSCAITEYY